jgi:hypothetical protein
MNRTDLIGGLSTVISCFLLIAVLLVVRVVSLVFAIGDLADGQHHVALDIILLVIAW